jgi:hypothetical protein
VLERPRLEVVAYIEEEGSDCEMNYTSRYQCTLLRRSFKRLIAPTAIKNDADSDAERGVRTGDKPDDPSADDTERNEIVSFVPSLEKFGCGGSQHPILAIG